MNDKINFVLEVISLAKKLNQYIDARLGSLHGISLTEFTILKAIYEETGKTIRRTELAAKSVLTPSGITRVIAPMEKTGLIEKEKNSRDARMSLVKLTEAGERVYKDAENSMGDMLKEKCAKINDDEEKLVLNSLKKLISDI